MVRYLLKDYLQMKVDHVDTQVLDIVGEHFKIPIFGCHCEIKYFFMYLNETSTELYVVDQFIRYIKRIKKNIYEKKNKNKLQTHYQKKALNDLMEELIQKNINSIKKHIKLQDLPKHYDYAETIYYKLHRRYKSTKDIDRIQNMLKRLFRMNIYKSRLSIFILILNVVK